MANPCLDALGNPITLDLCHCCKERHEDFLERPCGVEMLFLVAVLRNAAVREPAEMLKRLEHALAGESVESPKANEIKLALVCILE